MITTTELFPGTFQEALASTIIKSGDTLLLHGGSYAISGVSDLLCGLSGVTIKPYPSETAVLLGTTGPNNLFFGAGISNVTLDGLVFDGALGESSGMKIADGASNITIRNCEIKNFGTHGILITGATTHDVLIEDCYIHHCGEDNILEHGIYASSTGVIVRRCEVAYCGGLGIHIYGGAVDNVTLIENNYCHHNAKVGIGIYAGHCTVRNNVSRYNGEYAFSCRYSIRNALIQNNTFLGKVAATTFYELNPVIDFVNNVIFGGFYGVEVSAIGTAAINIDNCLIKATSEDYLFSPDGTGITLTNVINVDFTPLNDDTADSIIPATGNPVIGAGLYQADCLLDYGGNVRANPPAIGAWEPTA